jgi:LacI family transcriptional regulator
MELPEMGQVSISPALLTPPLPCAAVHAEWAEPSRQDTRSVALIYDATRAYDIKVMSGVAAYVQKHSNFSIYLEEKALKDQRLPDLRTWQGDGIIANFDHPAIDTAVSELNLAVVGFGGAYGWYRYDSPIPYFFSNNEKIGHMAADHLLDRGFCHFGYCGYARNQVNGWSEDRERAFAERIQTRGHSCDIYEPRYTSTRQWGLFQRSLSNWLTGLPKPVGIMAANDLRARSILEVCRLCGLRVPQEVAVIGVDNDELLCQLSIPPLSSIEQGAKLIGYQAAGLLDSMMRGEKPNCRHFVVDPIGVQSRRSTEAGTVEDPAVAKALAFIQQYALDGIRAADVVSAVSISRSGLESRFASELGYTVHDAIRQFQLERTRCMVAETSLPLKEVAARTGFKSVQHMTTLFGKAFSKSPAEYRREMMLFSLPRISESDA